MQKNIELNPHQLSPLFLVTAGAALVLAGGAVLATHLLLFSHTLLRRHYLWLLPQWYLLVLLVHSRRLLEALTQRYGLGQSVTLGFTNPFRMHLLGPMFM